MIGITSEGKVKARLGQDDHITLGTYCEKERAEEILQEIIKCYSGYSNFKVYKMPKE